MIEGMKKVPVVGEGSACSQKGSETSEIYPGQKGTERNQDAIGNMQQKTS